MELFTILKWIIYSQTMLSIAMAIFLLYFFIKNWSTPHKERTAMSEALRIFRGRKILLTTLQVYSWIFLIVWFSLVLTFFDFVIGIHSLTTWDDSTHTLTAWCGTFTGKEGDTLFLTLIIGILGAKAFFVLNHFAQTLKDDRLGVKRSGRLGYQTEL